MDKDKSAQNSLISATVFVLEVFGYVLVVYYDFFKLIFKTIAAIAAFLVNSLIIYPFKTISSSLAKFQKPKIKLPNRPNLNIKVPAISISRPKFHFPKFPEHRFPKVNKKEKSQKITESKLETKKVVIQTANTNLKKPMPIWKKLLFIAFFPFIVFYKVYHFITNIQFKFKPFSCLSIFFVIVLFVAYVSSVFYFSIIDELPDVNTLKKFDPKQTTNIYDRKGNLLYRTYNNEDRYYIPLKEIPIVIVNATLAVEDASFYEHFGLSVRGILRAAKKNFTEEDFQGGSTITQQLVKNTLLSGERTLTRKIKEAILAIEVERRFTKEQILEMYLNKISYGGTAYGIKSAASKYFDKDLSQISLAEASFLAGLPASPSNYSPLNNDISISKKRQKDVLDLMVRTGYITEKESDDAFKQVLAFSSKPEYIKAPHFVNYVMSDLEKKFGQKLISQGGLEVYTSIDMDMQNRVQEIITDDVIAMQRRNRVKNGAALITNPASGEVLAMIGSVNYWDDKNDGQVNITISPRQPGSSIKPITYAMAFENGLTPHDVIDDSAVSYPIPGEKPYTPVNYDGGFHGRVTLKSALANSYNIPAVKLLNQFGVENFLKMADQFGITTYTKTNRFGLAITLGAGEVKMVDMATAYGVFANNGYKIEVDPILKIFDYYGNTVYSNDCAVISESDNTILSRKLYLDKLKSQTNEEAQGFDKCSRTKIISENTAYYINDILSDNVARTPAFGARSNLSIKEKQVAVKTGTTTNVKDNWAIGYTKDFVVLTWIGNNDGEPMASVASGYVSASQLWRHTWDYLIKERKVTDKFSTPSNMVEVLVCPYTNTLACNGCSNVKRLYIKGTEPTKRCDPSMLPKKEDSEKDKDKDKDDD